MKQHSQVSKKVELNVINIETNEVVGKLALDPTIFAEEIRPDILSRVMQWQIDKARAGTHKTKEIGDISGTTKKPWKQKGTGRARQGSLRSPQFRGGAVIFGPVVRSHAYAMPKAVRRKALKVALSVKMAESKIIVVDNLSLSTHKTKNLFSKVATIGVNSGLFVGGDKQRDDNFYKACCNLHKIDVLPTAAINIYDILQHDHLILTKEAVEELTQRLA